MSSGNPNGAIITEFNWRRAQSTARRAARRDGPNDGLDRELAGSGRKFWDLVGSDGIGWDRTVLHGMGPAESTPVEVSPPGGSRGYLGGSPGRISVEYSGWLHVPGARDEHVKVL